MTPYIPGVPFFQLMLTCLVPLVIVDRTPGVLRIVFKTLCSVLFILAAIQNMAAYYASQTLEELYHFEKTLKTTKTVENIYNDTMNDNTMNNDNNPNNTGNTNTNNTPIDYIDSPIQFQLPSYFALAPIDYFKKTSEFQSFFDFDSPYLPHDVCSVIPIIYHTELLDKNSKFVHYRKFIPVPTNLVYSESMQGVLYQNGTLSISASLAHMFDMVENTNNIKQSSNCLDLYMNSNNNSTIDDMVSIDLRNTNNFEIFHQYITSTYHLFERSHGVVFSIHSLSQILFNSHVTNHQLWVIAGFIFSFGGDILLLGTGEVSFLIGLLSFLLGHVNFAIAFGYKLYTLLSHNNTLGFHPIGLGILIISLYITARKCYTYIINGEKMTPNMIAPVFAYICTIAVMVFSAGLIAVLTHDMLSEYTTTPSSPSPSASLSPFSSSSPSSSPFSPFLLSSSTTTGTTLDNVKAHDNNTDTDADAYTDHISSTISTNNTDINGTLYLKNSNHSNHRNYRHHKNHKNHPHQSNIIKKQAGIHTKSIYNYYVQPKLDSVVLTDVIRHNFCSYGSFAGELGMNTEMNAISNFDTNKDFFASNEFAHKIDQTQQDLLSFLKADSAKNGIEYEENKTSHNEDVDDDNDDEENDDSDDPYHSDYNEDYNHTNDTMFRQLPYLTYLKRSYILENPVLDPTTALSTSTSTSTSKFSSQNTPLVDQHKKHLFKNIKIGDILKYLHLDSTILDCNPLMETDGSCQSSLFKNQEVSLYDICSQKQGRSSKQHRNRRGISNRHNIASSSPNSMSSSRPRPTQPLLSNSEDVLSPFTPISDTISPITTTPFMTTPITSSSYLSSLLSLVFPHPTSQSSFNSFSTCFLTVHDPRYNYIDTSLCPGVLPSFMPAAIYIKQEIIELFRQKIETWPTIHHTLQAIGSCSSYVFANITELQLYKNIQYIIHDMKQWILSDIFHLSPRDNVDDSNLNLNMGMSHNSSSDSNGNNNIHENSHHQHQHHNYLDIQSQFSVEKKNKTPHHQMNTDSRNQHGLPSSSPSSSTVYKLSADSWRSFFSITGAIFFLISDIFVARAVFVKISFYNGMYGLPLYYYAQLLIATSLKY